MRRSTIVFIILTACISELRSQDFFASDLLALERKIYVCKTDSEKTPFLIQKLNLYISRSDYSMNALKEARRINYELISMPQQRDRFLWNAALLCQLNQQSDYAIYYYNRYKEKTGDSSITTTLLEILIQSSHDTSLVSLLTERLSSKDSSFHCLKCLNTMGSYEKRNRAAYILSSVVVPGLGTALEGYPLKGLNSLLISAAITYGVVALVQSQDYPAAILIGAGLGVKFYIGNIRLTNKLFTDRESRQKGMLAENCKHSMNELLKKYPLQFK